MLLKMPKLYVKKKCYRVNKWMLENLDDIDLLCEVGVLSSCHEIRHCSCCKHLLKWCLRILINRWEEIRCINFFDAIKIIKQNRFFFTNDFLIDIGRKTNKKFKASLDFINLQMSHYRRFMKIKNFSIFLI